MRSSPSSPTRRRATSGCPRPVPIRPTTTAIERGRDPGSLAMNSIWQENYAAIALHLMIALAAGGIIGLERSYHGRPAGFRTHALVCLSSCMLMILTVYQETWFSACSLERISVDPTRMAQGIMTGIGFLGAGVIMKIPLSLRMSSGHRNKSLRLRHQDQPARVQPVGLNTYIDFQPSTNL